MRTSSRIMPISAQYPAEEFRTPEAFNTLHEIYADPVSEEEGRIACERLTRGMFWFIRSIAHRFNVTYLSKEDLVQEGATLLALKLLPKYQKTEDRKTWIAFFRTGLRNKFIDLIHARGMPRKAHPRFTIEHVEYCDATVYETSEIPSIVDLCVTHERLQRLFAAIDQFPDTLRVVMRLRYQHGLERKAIARRLKTHPKRISHLLTTARIQLQQKMNVLLPSQADRRKKRAA